MEEAAAKTQIDDAIFATGGVDGLIKFWNIDSGWCLGFLNIARPSLNKLLIMPNRRQFGAILGRSVATFDIEQSKSTPIQEFQVSERLLTSFGINDECNCIHTTCEGGFIKLWDLRTRSTVQTYLNINSHQIHGVCCSLILPDSKKILYGDADGFLKLWDCRSNQCEVLYEDSIRLKRPIVDCSTDNIGKQILIMFDSGASVYWDYSFGFLRKEKRFNPHEGSGLRCKFIPEGTSFITTGSDVGARVWQLKDLEDVFLVTDNYAVCELPQTRCPVKNLDVRADCIHAITSAPSHSTAHMWHIFSGCTCVKFKHGSPIGCQAFLEGTSSISMELRHELMQEWW